MLLRTKMLPFDIRHIVVCHVQKKLFTIKNSPVFLAHPVDGDVPTGTPLTGASNARGYEKMTIFYQYLALSEKRL